MAGFKTCFKCNAVKPLLDFYKHSRMADGYLNKCKVCTQSDAAKHRNEHLDAVREYDRIRSKNRDRIRAAGEISKAWRAQDKRRAAAHSAVARAIKSGRLERQPCAHCGTEKAVAHHEDYDKPLDVMWLCQPCHTKRHVALKKMLQQAKVVL